MTKPKPYRHKKEYPQEAARRIAVEVTLEALNMMLCRNQQGDKIEVVMGTGGKVHVKAYRRGF